MPVKFDKVILSLGFMNYGPTNHQKIIKSAENLATKHGLLFFGVTDLAVTQDYERYQQWLNEGRQAGMAYLERNLPVRANPKLLLDGAQTAWIFGLPYYLGDKWRRADKQATPKFAMYSRIKDYHKILRTGLESLFSELLHTTYPQSETPPAYRVTVDSVPLLERALAANTGSGFIGKNTCVIHPRRGSFFLLGEVLTTWNPGVAPTTQSLSKHRERTPDGGCGSCKRCQVHCPTGALDKDYQIDARKCLSWWTIENRGVIPKEYWPWIARYVYGCDICQLVCPWNRGIEVSPVAEQYLRLPSEIDLFTVATMNQATYESIFAGTPATRAKREGLIRNALIAMHVRGDARLERALEMLLHEPSEAVQGTIMMIQEEFASS